MDHSCHYSNLFGDTTTTTTEEHNLTMSSSSGPMARAEVSGMATIKAQGRRRSRASIKPPIRVLPAHKSNFRDMVQKLTGLSNDIAVQVHHNSNPNPSNPSNSMNHHHHHHPYLKNPHADPMIYSHLLHPTTHAPTPHHELLKRLTNFSPPHLLQDMPTTLDTSSAYLLHRSSSPVRAPLSDICGPTSSTWTPMDDDFTSNPTFNNISIGDDDMHHHHDVKLSQSLYPNYYTNSINGANYLGSLLHHHHHHPDGNLVYTNGGSSSTILPQYGVNEADDASCNVTTRVGGTTSDPWGAGGADIVPYATTFSTQPSVTDPRVGGLIMSRSGVDRDHKMMLCQADTFMARAAELERLLMGNDDKMDNDLPHSHGSSSTINASVMNTTGPLITHSKLVYQCL